MGAWDTERRREGGKEGEIDKRCFISPFNNNYPRESEDTALGFGCLFTVWSKFGVGTEKATIVVN